MAITDAQLVQVGFTKGFNRKKEKTVTLNLEEDGTLYARFWKDKDKLKCWSIDNPQETEFIFLEHLTVKGLELFIERTATRIRKFKNNVDSVRKLIEDGYNQS
jgi:hypothetical protein